MNEREQKGLTLAHRVTLGNATATNFLCVWALYVHAIDDVVDEMPTAEEIIGAFMLAHNVYNHPYYLAHRLDLNPMITAIANAYADSEAWAKSEEPWQRQFAEVMRHHGAEMFLTVANIEGGWKHRRAMSATVREFYYHESEENL